MAKLAKRKLTVNPHIDKMLDVSTAHITPEDDKLLRKNTRDTEEIKEPHDFLSVIDHNFGYFVLAQDLTQDEKRVLYVFGYSEALISLIGKAYDLGCKWICLDGDGFTYEDLPSFEW